ncbi:lysylphosphatidylglycerol synthase transmembrane domain-containing protein [Algoriphagus machipongonensis]|uniref:Integral membrane protein n=1 Tax=Algoriphagus machipongonensis TaxID=388413 RepID=A3HVC7_9BACT|nr:lysylphosphatidylglycerol synthase transmembrane domain-containing protein [Algoriphagus machipongonensis]EAZ82099.1 putative integral membrane protein [Algoriphagus machipongonensis]
MNNQKLKQWIQVAISLGIAVWIFWFLYKDIAIESLIQQIKTSNWLWIGASIFISFFGYYLRGWRWTLLIHEVEGKKVTPNRGYHATMVGYLVNLLIPRAGEVAKCGVLTRTNGVSLGHLLGTVILERSVDLLCLIATIFLAFILQNELFIELAGQLVNIDSLLASLQSNLPIVFGGLLVLILILRLIFKRFSDHGIINKIQHFFREIGGGLKRIGQMDNPWGFWIGSIVLWIIYFMTMYLVSLGISSTANLSSGEVLLVMVMGSIGMVAPVQGGIGTFHALVAFILIQFGVSEVDGKIFAAIIHGTQLILVIVLGLISWLTMMKLPTYKQPESH